jgi:flagellar hook-associated protein 1 FlgK
MSNISAALNSMAGAISAFDTALTVSQNNIANAKTPGYVEQTATFEPLPIDYSIGGASGGVVAGPVIDARDVYAESAVQQAQTALGNWTQQLGTLQALQSSFPIDGTTGIPGALNRLYSAFSGWAASPNDSNARQAVITASHGLEQAFQQQASAVSSAAQGAENDLTNLVNHVNTLTGKIRQDNISLGTAGGASDAAVQADLYNNLEQLSAIVPITTIRQSDGATEVLLNGQTPLVVGQTQYKIAANVAVPQSPPPTYPSAPPGAQVLDSDGADITREITSGQIGGVLQAVNVTLAQMQGSASQQGSLNQLAQAVADRVNSVLTSGNITNANPVNGTPAMPGVALFTYDATNPAGIAASFSVSPGMTPDQLAAIDPGPPEVDNGIPLALANLATPQTAADEINGMSYNEFYGTLAGQLGTAVSTAQSNQQSTQETLTQAQTLRQQSSGVDLNQEAIRVLQFQQAYDAASKMVAILDQVTQDFLNAIPTAG